jgi:hypothetical protein
MPRQDGRDALVSATFKKLASWTGVAAFMQLLPMVTNRQPAHARSCVRRKKKRPASERPGVFFDAKRVT